MQKRLPNRSAEAAYVRIVFVQNFVNSGFPIGRLFSFITAGQCNNGVCLWKPAQQARKFLCFLVVACIREQEDVRTFDFSQSFGRCFAERKEMQRNRFNLGEQCNQDGNDLAILFDHQDREWQNRNFHLLKPIEHCSFPNPESKDD